MRNGCSLGMVAEYPLRLLPGEQFAGLPLLCLQYVVLQIAFPKTEVTRSQ